MVSRGHSLRDVVRQWVLWNARLLRFANVPFFGDTPWDEPTANSPEFRAYCTNHRLNFDPWTRFPPQALGGFKSCVTRPADLQPTCFSSFAPWHALH